MAFPCPRCGDRYTQSLPMAYGSGTYVRNWRSRSGYKGTTVSQSIIGSLASPPAKRSVWKPVLGMILVALLLAPTIEMAWYKWIAGEQRRSTAAPIIDGPSVRHRHHSTAAVSAINPAPIKDPSWTGLLYVLGFCLLLEGVLLWRLVRSARFNWNVHPQLMRNWQLSFLCKQCGAVFYPPDAATIIPSP